MDAQNNSPVVTFKVCKRLDSHTAPEAERQLSELAGTAARGLLCDLGECEYVSSMGLRVLLSCAKTMQKNGRAFGLCRASSYVLEILELAGFTRVLKVYDSVESALKEIGA